jgi:flagellar biosynthesis protein FlhG
MLGQAERIIQLNNYINPQKDVGEKPKIISFTSGKGGTGKSFLASNIAMDLALNNIKILLIDLDLNLANQHALFNISTNKTLYHYLTYNQDLQDLIQRSNVHSNLSLILGESGKIDHPGLNEDRAKFLISDLKQLSMKFDLILLDTSSGITNGSIQLLLKSDQIILVTTPEPTSVMDGYVIFKLLKANGGNIPSSVIVNKSFNEKEAIEAFQNLEKATKHFLNKDLDYLGEITFSADVVRSIQEQNLIIQTSKSPSICHQIKQISSKLKKTTLG